MRRPARKFLATLLATALGACALVVLGIAGAFQYLEPELPEAAELRDLRMQLPLTVYSRDGRLIAQIGEQRRIPVEAADIPQVVVDAFLAAEDDRFFQHPGVDWQGLVRALATNVSAGGVHEGGGTITMQLARNTVLTSERTGEAARAARRSSRRQRGRPGRGANGRDPAGPALPRRRRAAGRLRLQRPRQLRVRAPRHRRAA